MVTLPTPYENNTKFDKDLLVMGIVTTRVSFSVRIFDFHTVL